MPTPNTHNQQTIGNRHQSTVFWERTSTFSQSDITTFYPQTLELLPVYSIAFTGEERVANPYDMDGPFCPLLPSSLALGQRIMGSWHLGPSSAMAPHSSTLAWKIPWTEEPGGLQCIRALRVGSD